MPTILDKIVATKRDEIARAKVARPAGELRAAIRDAPPVRDFVAALRAPRDISLIAEVKKASPSAGLIREDFNPVAIAQTYEAHGASCISVLTDEQYFQGSLDYLRDIRAAVGVPCLRKDFVLDEHQLLEARAAGADAVLLIAECLTSDELKRLYLQTRDLGMHALIELYEVQNVEGVLATGCPLVGVNNRNLHTFEVDLQHTVRVRQQLPEDRTVVGESGIQTRAEALLLEAAGVDAMLVGESLMRQADIGAAVDMLLGR